MGRWKIKLFFVVHHLLSLWALALCIAEGSDVFSVLLGVNDCQFKWVFTKSELEGSCEGFCSIAMLACALENEKFVFLIFVYCGLEELMPGLANATVLVSTRVVVSFVPCASRVSSTQ